MAMKFDNIRSLVKKYPDGSAFKAWKNNAGISIGYKKESDGIFDPFMSAYSRQEGGYVLVIRKNLLEMNNIKLEIVDE